MVDSCAGAACIYIVRHLFWCMDWIFMVGFSRFGCLCQAFLGFSCYAMPGVLVSNDIDHLTGHQENPEIELYSISICMNLNGWEVMIALGFDVAINVRVSNELGARHPNAAKFSVMVVILTSLLIGIFFMILIFVINIQEVMHAVTKLATLLALTMILNSVQPVLSRVAVGVGWQDLVAYVNIGHYYLVGLPIGIPLVYKMNLGAKGIWSGMIGGMVLPTSRTRKLKTMGLCTRNLEGRD